MSEETGSDFGAGCVYCLMLFANHFDNAQWRRIVEYNWAISGTEISKEAQWWLDHMVPIHNGNKEKALSMDIESWANGASDHLYELEIPTNNPELADILSTIKETGLNMGHGFNSAITWTVDDMCGLRDLTLRASMLIDKQLGVKVIKAQWE